MGKMENNETITCNNTQINLQAEFLKLKVVITQQFLLKFGGHICRKVVRIC